MPNFIVDVLTVLSRDDLEIHALNKESLDILEVWLCQLCAQDKSKLFERGVPFLHNTKPKRWGHAMQKKQYFWSYHDKVLNEKLYYLTHNKSVLMIKKTFQVCSASQSRETPGRETPLHSLHLDIPLHIPILRCLSLNAHLQLYNCTSVINRRCLPVYPAHQPQEATIANSHLNNTPSMYQKLSLSNTRRGCRTIKYRT